jgi:hypothetical protein
MEINNNNNNNRYAGGKIYTIRSHQTDKFYIGSTCLPLHKRLWLHRRDYNLFVKGKFHNISSFDIIKFDDHYIELLENFNCNNKEELTKKEGDLIRQYKNEIVNIKIEGRTLKEYREDNKDVLNQKRKQYNQDNKDKIKIYQKEYREDNKDTLNQKHICECGGKFTKKYKSIHLKTNKHIEFMKTI